MLKQVTVVLALAGLAPLALVAPASAAQGGGAERYGFENVCISEPPFQFCRTQRGVFNLTETAAGHFHLVDNGKLTFTSTDGALTETGAIVYQQQLLLKEGEEHVLHIHSRFSSKDSTGFTCRGTDRLMIVKGELQREIHDFSCRVASKPQP